MIFGFRFAQSGLRINSDAKTHRENDLVCVVARSESDEAIQNLTEDWIASLCSQ
jgi:hypothetical protein